jgi:hypothetical protein
MFIHLRPDFIEIPEFRRTSAFNALNAALEKKI